MTGLQMNTLSNTDCWRPTDTQMPQDGKIKDGASNPQDDGRKVNGKEECQTCKQRKYQDGSDESDVSFKSAAHVSPESAGAAVRAHENQHVKNAYEKAEKDNGKVLSATVTIKTGRCPECGRTYVAGGTTKTMIKYTDETNPYQQNQKALDAGEFSGKNINTTL